MASKSTTAVVRKSSADFFKAKESGKCSTCPLTRKKGLVNFKHDSPVLKKVGSHAHELWVILEMPEPQFLLQELEYQLKAAQITEYTIILGAQCQAKQFELPSPIYSTFKSCHTTTDADELLRLPTPKAIITVGRALNAITHTDDLISWREFVEAQFNPSFFYTSHWTKDKRRVYPIPALFDWCNKDNYEKIYVQQQLIRIRKYLEPDTYTQLAYHKPRTHLIEDPNAFLREHTARACEVVLDLETSSLYHFAEDFEVGCLTLAFDDRDGYYLRWKDIDPEVLDAFLLNKTQIYANGKFDTKGMLVSRGIKNAIVHHDIVLLFHCLSTERMANGLKSLAWLVGDGGYDQPLEEYKKRWNPKNYLEIPEEILFPYATMDAVVTFKLYKLGLALARRQPDIFNLYKNTYIPVIPVFQEMEIDGLDIDKPKLITLHNQLVRDAATIERSIKLDLNVPQLLLTSTSQLGLVLENKGLPDLGRNEDGSYKTGANELQRWAKMGHEVCTKILRFRSLTKLDASFVGELEEDDPEQSAAQNFFGRNSNRTVRRKKKKRKNGLVQHLRKDGKVHGTWAPAMADSGRSRSYDPNLQNQTRHSEEAQQFRSVFKCPYDSYIYELDLDGFQLRIACVLSGDPVMEDIFLNRGGDMHSITGQGVFARNIELAEFLARVKAEDPIASKWRQDSKQINFGFVFGRSAGSFKEDLELSWSEDAIDEFIASNNLELLEDRRSRQLDPYLTVATELRSRFFRTYSRLEKWIEECREEGRSQGYTDSYFGGRRHTPWLRYRGDDEDTARYSNYQNIATNSRVQNFEAVMIYRAMRKIRDAIKREKMKSTIRLMVHDSIGGYVKKDESKEFYHLLKECVEDHTSYRIPFTAEVKYGEIWGFGKKVNARNLDLWATGQALLK